MYYVYAYKNYGRLSVEVVQFVMVCDKIALIFSTLVIEQTAFVGGGRKKSSRSDAQSGAPSRGMRI